MARITISIPDDQLEQIKGLVAAHHADSVAHFVRHAVKNLISDVTLYEQDVRDLLAATGGPLTAEELAWVERILGAAPDRAA